VIWRNKFETKRKEINDLCQHLQSVSSLIEKSKQELKTLKSRKNVCGEQHNEYIRNVKAIKLDIDAIIEKQRRHQIIEDDISITKKQVNLNSQRLLGLKANFETREKKLQSMKNINDQQKKICSLRTDIDKEKKKLENYTSEVVSWNPEEQRIRFENISKRTRTNNELLGKILKRQSRISTNLQNVEREDMRKLNELMKLIESEDLRQRKG